MTSEALLLITLVTYSGQLVWLATVTERLTASASTWNTEEFTLIDGGDDLSYSSLLHFSLRHFNVCTTVCQSPGVLDITCIYKGK